MTSSDSLLTSSDAVRLQEIFDDLAERKDDAQQRSWYLHADEHVISGAWRRRAAQDTSMTSLTCVPPFRNPAAVVVAVGGSRAEVVARNRQTKQLHRPPQPRPLLPNGEAPLTLHRDVSL